MSSERIEPRRIALIDDEPGVLHALQLLLEVLSFSVTPFSSPMAALAAIKEQTCTPDIIICDVRMAELDGFQVLATCREIAPAIPVLLMSGHATSEERLEAQARGAFDLLPKPFGPEELLASIERLRIPRRETL